MNAIYTVIENGRKSYFGTNIADGFGYPFVVFSYAERMARVLNENDPMGTVKVAEVFPLMKANSIFPENVIGEKIFCPLSNSVFHEYEADMPNTDYTSFKITLDFDKRKIGFIFNRNCPELPAPKIEKHLDRRDARETFGTENPFMSIEKFYRIELESSVLESPVFRINIQSDKTDISESAIMPISYREQTKLADDLQTANLNDCEVVSVTAFDQTLNAHLRLDGEKFSKLNELAGELNKLRLDCGDNAFNSFVKANKIAPFCDADIALTAVDNIRKYCALQETQGMDLRM